MTKVDSNLTNSSTIKYVMENLSVDPQLIEIYLLDKEACSKEEAKTYFEYCIEAAKNGSLFAMLLISSFYQNGWGVGKALDQAIYWLTKSSNANFAPAVFELGLYYENGIIECSIETAIGYYTRAIELGYGVPALYMASLLYSGEKVNKNIDKAIDYAKQAYKLGDLSSAGFLGNWYEEIGASKDNYKNAVYWYEVASDNGDPLSSNRLYRAYLMGQLGLNKDEKMAEKYHALIDSQLGLL